jgi:hypothetical protein
MGMPSFVNNTATTSAIFIQKIAISKQKKVLKLLSGLNLGSLLSMLRLRRIRLVRHTNQISLTQRLWEQISQ